MSALPTAQANPPVSVVIATYNRRPLLARLLRQLDAQQYPMEHAEVVVVDDGSAEPVKPFLDALELTYPLTVLTQANAGAAAARHRGVTAARGEVVVIVDDDMQVGTGFIASHMGIHQRSPHAVVMGKINPDPSIRTMPVFERYHASRLQRWADGYRAGRFALRGNNLCTGNVSFVRGDYLAVGGFDPALQRSEDAELGLRLEALGAHLHFSEQASVQHGSDHLSAEQWQRGAFRYGVFDLRIGRKHPQLTHADPWRFLFMLRAPARPFLGLSLAAPTAASWITRGAMAAAQALDGAGLEGVALETTALVFGMEYFRGIRSETQTMAGALRSMAEYLTKAGVGESRETPAPRALAAAARAASDFQTDRQVRARYEDKHGYAGERGQGLAGELVSKIGVQLAAGVRLMRFFRDAGQPLAAKVSSRMIRYAFGSDIHWDAELAPGVMFIHGFGLAISHAAVVGPGCILSQNVTLGMGLEPGTGRSGAPTLGANVHVGPGATLIGPITVGDNSKIMPGVVLTHSVPPNSIVEAPVPATRKRAAAPRPIADPS